MSNQALWEFDWAITYGGRQLHHVAVLTTDFENDVEGIGTTSCGRRTRVMIPGVFSRMSLKRCDRCCDKIGYPRGIGSPKNDKACRSLVFERLGITDEPNERLKNP